MRQDCLGQLIANLQKRIERRERILKHHPDLFAPNAAHLVAVEPVNSRVVEVNLATGNARRSIQEPNDRVSGHRLARATFANNTKYLARSNVIGHPINGFQNASAGWDFDHKVADRENRLGQRRHSLIFQPLWAGCHSKRKG